MSCCTACGEPPLAVVCRSGAAVKAVASDGHLGVDLSSTFVLIQSRRDPSKQLDAIKKRVLKKHFTYRTSVAMSLLSTIYFSKSLRIPYQTLPPTSNKKTVFFISTKRRTKAMNLSCLCTSFTILAPRHSMRLKTHHLKLHSVCTSDCKRLL